MQVLDSRKERLCEVLRLSYTNSAFKAPRATVVARHISPWWLSLNSPTQLTSRSFIHLNHPRTKSAFVALVT